MTTDKLTGAFTPLNDADAALARKAYQTLDLTSLTGTETRADLEALVAKAVHPKLGHVAAICVYPEHIATVRELLAVHDAPIRIATVINFPHGDRPNSVPPGASRPFDTLVYGMQRDIEAALAAGADEIDLVFPYTLLQKGDDNACRLIIKAAAQACANAPRRAPLKVILETAAFDDADLLRTACDISLENGADILKTSTGKHASGGATPQAVAILLDALVAAKPMHRMHGLKVSGGVSTFEGAKAYIQQASDRMGSHFITPLQFRLGSSGLADDVFRKLGLIGPVSGAPAPAPTTY
jgi:deoxyribose-phosphate aldolase